MKIIEGSIASPKGFYADGLHCGIRFKNNDIGWLYSETPATVAGVFTTNQVQAAPVIVTKEKIQNGQLQAVVVNSGNANACTGATGLHDAKAMTTQVAERLGIADSLVGVASTGVIGQKLPMATVTSGISQLKKNGEALAFHQAILTTDISTKEIVVTDELNGERVTMAGVAKGSGMIHPNMATMLAFITTDATIGQELLQELLKELTETTFNQITIDGDTSTNDMVLVLANGQTPSGEITADSEAYQIFKSMLQVVMEELAKKIAADGEGATKLIEATVTHAQNQLAARMIAKTIVGSSLVKTAMFGKDPNWGRIICSIGYAGIEVNPQLVQIELAGIPVFAKGEPVAFDEEIMATALVQETIEIEVDLQQGEACGKAWGCDLTYDYIKINALYHT